MIRILFLALFIFQPAAKALSRERLITPTIYYRPVYDSDRQLCGDEYMHKLNDVNGNTIVTLCEEEYKNCLMQGSCIIQDKNDVKRSYNYIGMKNRLPYFAETTDTLKRCKYGVGVDRICVDPFYSVAADLSIYKPGDVIYIPQINGLKMPDGTRHSGYFIVRDSGSKIKGRGRFDFYVGFHGPFDDTKNPFAQADLNDKTTHLDFVYVSDYTTAEAARKSRRFPYIP